MTSKAPSIDPTLWSSFTDDYTQNGRDTERTRNINLLREFVESDISPQAFIAKHADLGFDEVKRALDDACSTQSYDDKGKDSTARQLNDYITGRLVDKWITLLTENKLYPPPESKHISQAMTKQREAIRKQQPGGMLSSAIASSCAKTITGGAKKARGRLAFATGIDPDAIQGEAVRVFYNTLFRYHDEKAPEEFDIGSNFKVYLFGRIDKMAGKVADTTQRGAFSLDAERGPGDERTGHERQADERTADPTRNAEVRDQFAIIQGIMQNELTTLEQDVVKMRFGLNDEGRVYELKEIGDIAQVTSERVRQIESRALRLIQAHAKTMTPQTASDTQSSPPPAPFLMPTDDDKKKKARDYPYASLKPDGEISDDAAKIERAKAKHIATMTEAGMPERWAQAPAFYDHVRAQWQQILETRKAMRQTSLLDPDRKEKLAILLLRALIMHDPEARDAKTQPDEALTDVQHPSYNALHKRLAAVDFRSPSHIAQRFIYDPKWRKEVTKYLAHIPAETAAKQVSETFRPDRFDANASFGECLEAYATCGGQHFDEFLKLYAEAKGYTKERAGKRIVSADMFSKELHEGAEGGTEIDRRKIAFWVNPTSHSRPALPSAEHRELMEKRYALTNRQKKCLALICGAVNSLDSPRTIIERASETLRSEDFPNMQGVAADVLVSLIGITPNLTPEGLSRKLGGAVSAKPLQRWVKHRHINTEAAVAHIDEIAAALLPDDPAMAKKAANLMLGLPSPDDMSFNEAVQFARTQRYTIAEFIDMRRYQMRDTIKPYWEGTHTNPKHKAFQGFVDYLLDKPADIKLNRRQIDSIRKEGKPPEEIATANYLGKKLGAETTEDLIAFRQIMYAKPKGANQKKINNAFDRWEAAENSEDKKNAFAKIYRRAQNYYGLRTTSDMVRDMLDYACEQGMAEIDFDTMRTAVGNVGKGDRRTTPEAANIIASYLFRDDADRKERLLKRITSDKKQLMQNKREPNGAGRDHLKTRVPARRDPLKPDGSSQERA